MTEWQSKDNKLRTLEMSSRRLIPFIREYFKSGVTWMTYDPGQLSPIRNGVVNMKKNGALVYDERTERFDIRFGLEEHYGGLHCGDCFDVKINGEWKSTRIEMAFDEGWYLVGVPEVKKNELNP